MQAITTKYIGATNNKPSRIKATAANGKTLTISYPHDYDTTGAHREAAILLVQKLGWLSQHDPRSPYRIIGIVSGEGAKEFVHVLITHDMVTDIGRGAYAFADVSRRK